MKSIVIAIRMTPERLAYLKEKGNVRRLIHEALEAVYPDIPPDDRKAGRPRKTEDETRKDDSSSG